MGHQGILAYVLKTTEMYEIRILAGWCKHVEIYARRCDMCCRNRKGPQFRHGLLQSAPGLTVMQKFHINLTDFHDRSRNEFTYLLMAICCLSKYLVAVPLRDKSALSVARALVKHVYMVFGAPEFVRVNDRGREFSGQKKKILMFTVAPDRP